MLIAERNGIVAPRGGADKYVPWVADKNGDKTAVTIGSRGAGNVGVNSLTNGNSVVASGDNGHAEGFYTTASGIYGHAEGCRAKASTTTSYVWQGSASPKSTDPEYTDHGAGTYNINPVPASGSDDPASGFYIGESSLALRLAAVQQTFSHALSGKTYDFAANSEIIRAIIDVVEAMGGTITESPEPPTPTPGPTKEYYTKQETIAAIENAITHAVFFDTDSLDLTYAEQDDSDSSDSSDSTI